MEREPKQKHSGESAPDSVSRNIDNSMNREQERGNERSEAIALIRSFLEGKNSAEDNHNPSKREHNRRPAQLCPKPKPVAFRMQGAPVADRRFAKKCKDGLEIS